MIAAVTNATARRRKSRTACQDAMKLIRTKGRGAAGRDISRSNARRRGARHVLRRQAHRGRCAQAAATARCLRYAAQFDGLAGPASSARHSRRDGGRMECTQSRAARCTDHRRRADSRHSPSASCPTSWSASPIDGLTTGQLVRPLGSVGCYVPSGRHPLPSTLLMTAIPAQVAGVERIVVVSPKPAPETLAAAHLLGITEFYRLGGAHAIAALAYGTATIRARRQDRRPRQSLRHRGQAPRRLRLRHRHARRPH